MILSIILPLCGLSGMDYTFHSIIPCVTNEILLFFCTILKNFFVQTPFIEQFFQYSTYFKTEHKLVHYLVSLI